MAVNWNMLGQNTGNNALAYFDMGQKMGADLRARQDAEATKKALIGYATNPNDPKAFNDLITANPEFALQARKQQIDTAAAAAERTRKQAEDISRLFNGVDPQNWGERVAAARQMGIDTSTIPSAYDPNWVAQTGAIFRSVAKDGGAELTSSMRELKALGYDLNTPQGKQALADMINAREAKPYTDANGATRLATPQMVVPAAPAGPPPQKEPFTFDMFKAYGSPEGAAAYVKKYGYRVSVRTPQEARQLPSGTPITLPDGTEGVVP